MPDSGSGGAVLLTTRETAESERRAIAQGTSGFSLMQRAGRAAAELCLKRPNLRSVAVICGPGNNGSDGFIVASQLAAVGCRVSVFAPDPAGPWQGDAAEARRQWTGEVKPATAFAPRNLDLIVDALFGSGLSRPIAGATADLVAAINESACPVLAIDVPSGVDGTTGAILGIAVMATETITFGTAKPGHYLYPGRGRRGWLVVDAIGLPRSPTPDGLFLNAPALWLQDFPWPTLDGHKYRRGHAVVVSGGMSHTGAARLAARAALRVGAGLVTLASPSDALAVNAAHLTAVMLRAADGVAGLHAVLSDPRRNGVVLGPGLGVGEATCDLVATALAPQVDLPKEARPRACLLDADALTSFAGDAARLRGLIASAPGPVVITPHDGEFSRLFSEEGDILGGSKLDRARAAARFLGCVVLLKGPDTVIAAPTGRAAIAEGGAPWLATAGSGDVLSGLIGGLLTQGMSAFEAAAAGDYLHTASAQLFGPGLIAEDLPEMLPKALRELYDASGISRS